jgi:hypothetical protein
MSFAWAVSTPAALPPCPFLCYPSGLARAERESAWLREGEAGDKGRRWIEVGRGREGVGQGSKADVIRTWQLRPALGMLVVTGPFLTKLMPQVRVPVLPPPPSTALSSCPRCLASRPAPRTHSPDAPGTCLSAAVYKHASVSRMRAHTDSTALSMTMLSDAGGGKSGRNEMHTQIYTNWRDRSPSLPLITP